YEYLREKKIVKSDAGIKEALQRILRNDGKINRVFPPPARGPEIIMRLSIPEKKRWINLTNNDLWSVIVLYIDYNENWQSMILDLEENTTTGKIVDAQKKKLHLQKLLEKMKQTGLTPSRLLYYLKPDRYQIERAKKWFYQKKFVSG
ncbi:hypothetical protein H5U35_05745, partial [Candidatus Aerophobetes bacterium]|nr:hypothetical protein [Candidatus Aerophobetes bacterium]